ncbi:hypothetical protein BABINDRAFT_162755 [Babjeviella inositovora NRRL Y-12698]|uniref:Uncharacterized protein n=1 Tax=Babjeviella inositovora NRRL Y-12698 TaxID=984486 RepID=A0A1E3QLH3_9ASCO|nr:uncharacterized protein BABINDRAFT_162755 [Babjeviella inositovora NRRL Y-12698]ODQ78549.1 hypothetical protein BABINDRAFT_162755 [Babjeviella inositovora NRRL Y-12698]
MPLHSSVRRHTDMRALHGEKALAGGVLAHLVRNLSYSSFLGGYRQVTGGTPEYAYAPAVSRCLMNVCHVVDTPENP